MDLTEFRRTLKRLSTPSLPTRYSPELSLDHITFLSERPKSAPIRTSNAFLLGPGSHTKTSTSVVSTRDTHSHNDSPHRSLYAKFRVHKMRQYLSTSSPPSSSPWSTSPPTLPTPTGNQEEKTNLHEQKDSGKTPSIPKTSQLPKLKNDFLWLSLVLILNPNLSNPATCQICKNEITSPYSPHAAAAWRIQGCKHQVHVRCFRDLHFPIPNPSPNPNPPSTSNSTPSPSQTLHLESVQTSINPWPSHPASLQDNCGICKAIQGQVLRLSEAEFCARVRRVEGLVLPWMGGSGLGAAL